MVIDVNNTIAFYTRKEIYSIDNVGISKYVYKQCVYKSIKNKY